MSDSLILTDVRDGVATLTLNRPEKLNAFAGDMREKISAGLDQIAADPTVRVLVVTGAGRGFSAGGDIKFMVDLKQKGAGYESLSPLLEAGREAIRRITALPYPTIAAVNGVAAGGGLNLALACDLRIASDQASFGQSFVKIGLHVDWSGAYHLPRLVGLAKALELCWLGDLIDANEALRIGLVNRVVPSNRFRDEVGALAARLAAAPQTCIRLAKQTLRASASSTLEESMAAEVFAQEQCWNSADSAEGVNAFAEKRTPDFGAALDPELAGNVRPNRFE